MIKQLYKGTAIGVGKPVGRQSNLSEIQLTVEGNGAVNAKIQVFASTDRVAYIDLGEMEVLGTNTATITDEIQRSYSDVYVEVLEISTNTTVTVTMSELV